MYSKQKLQNRALLLSEIEHHTFHIKKVGPPNGPTFFMFMQLTCRVAKDFKVVASEKFILCRHDFISVWGFYTLSEPMRFLLLKTSLTISMKSGKA